MKQALFNDGSGAAAATTTTTSIFCQISVLFLLLHIASFHMSIKKQKIKLAY